MNNYQLGEVSKRELGTCHPDLQRIAYRLIKLMDVSIICGTRTNDEQDRLYREGKSKLKGGQSKHNSFPSRAMDVAPYPYPDEYSRPDMHRLYLMAGLMRGIAAALDIPVRIGADWDGDGEITDQTFHDVFHIELADPPDEDS